MLTNKISRRLDLPHEKGEWIEIRMPSLAILDAARNKRSLDVVALMSGVDLSNLRGLERDDKPTMDNEDAAGLYDWQILLSACITGWSYSEPVSPDSVSELDELTVHFVTDALLSTESASERKNGSRRSMKP